MGVTEGATDERAGEGRAWMLAIDTSTEQAGLALDDGHRAIERSWHAGRSQTTTVLPAIDALLREAGITVVDLAAIAVAIGPGTFTGLRVGVSIAKGLILAREIPLIGIPTLDVTAAGGDASAQHVVAVLPAGRGRVVWQRYGRDADVGPHNTTVAELVDALADSPDALVVGELGGGSLALLTAVAERDAHPHARFRLSDPSLPSITGTAGEIAGEAAAQIGRAACRERG